MEIFKSNGFSLIESKSLSSQYLFIASQVLKKLEINASINQIKYSYCLNENEIIKITKKSNQDVFDEIIKLGLIGKKSSEVILITESCLWKLAMQSQSNLGKLLRDWISNNILKPISQNTSQEVFQLVRSGHLAVKHAPHFEATEAVIEDLWQKGIGLEAIKDTGLHQDLTNSFQKMLSLGVNLKELGSSAEKWRNEQKNKK